MSDSLQAMADLRARAAIVHPRRAAPQGLSGAARRPDAIEAW
jgi:hypothetical protein